MSSLRSLTYAALRITAGLFFMLHGGQKLFGWFGGVDGAGGTVPLASLIGFAGALELFGGLCVMLGLLTRPVAFVLAGEMAVAYFKSHFPNGFWPIQNHGESAALFCFVFVFFAAHGAGPFSLDAAMHRGVRGERRRTPIPVHAH